LTILFWPFWFTCSLGSPVLLSNHLTISAHDKFYSRYILCALN
jgi:hypothetical protein